MNSKRQTVWLVSMLSLMVVLSAYYLFTDDVNELQAGTETTKTQEIKYDATAVTGQDKVKTNAPDNTAKTDAAPADKETSAAEAAGEQGKTDEELLQQVSAQAMSAEEYFIDANLRRDEELTKMSEKLMTIINDSKQNNEAVTKAYEDMYKLEEQHVKMISLEDQLATQFGNAVVVQDGSKYKVVVMADKLQRSEAVSIIDMTMKELGIGADRVSVEFKN
ncbi:SpoIIIAH-like family protein [Paenibacillus turpanensis]|uniref:SpoIIIAH-like family protein n=1 Tax=Paenibacillus turpanensis TaxID=2689078 RepID=UPI00140868AA|nr:SpoIIIAH-like family protein [Paenibacillus turpanensis]